MFGSPTPTKHTRCPASSRAAATIIISLAVKVFTATSVAAAGSARHELLADLVTLCRVAQDAHAVALLDIDLVAQANREGAICVRSAKAEAVAGLAHALRQDHEAAVREALAGDAVGGEVGRALDRCNAPAGHRAERRSVEPFAAPDDVGLAIGVHEVAVERRVAV